jgi:hypothetical protein
MAFVRTKRVGEREYRQLVENYREDGRHRQRVLAHLGKHETLEEAIDAARAKLEEVDNEKYYEAARQVLKFKEGIRAHFGEQIDRYHGGEIPDSGEVCERARLYWAPRTDEPVSRSGLGHPLYGYRYKEVEVPERVEEYRRSFGRVEERDYVAYYGSRFRYGGLSTFSYWLHEYQAWSKRRDKLSHTYDSRKARLQKLEAVLNSGD